MSEKKMEYNEKKTIAFSLMATLNNFRSAGKNHSADIKNANKGTNGTNITYDKKQENRGKQLNPNQKKNKQEEQAVKCRKKF